MKFEDRSEAGRRLADKLAHLRDRKPVVLALPRGGVAVGFGIARALDAPLDIVLVRKIGVPWEPELALGAVTDGASPETFMDREPPPDGRLSLFMLLPGAGLASPATCTVGKANLMPCSSNSAIENCYARARTIT